ncbi:MAG: sigma 54-interacting transcriptional regulator [Kiritimatiellae bacterium]|nr:sigma 54-interacting transcriptional regulator [Kiritimatiellia bacterium]
MKRKEGKDVLSELLDLRHRPRRPVTDPETRRLVALASGHVPSDGSQLLKMVLEASKIAIEMGLLWEGLALIRRADNVAPDSAHREILFKIRAQERNAWHLLAEMDRALGIVAGVFRAAPGDAPPPLTWYAMRVNLEAQAGRMREAARHLEELASDSRAQSSTDLDIVSAHFCWLTGETEKGLARSDCALTMSEGAASFTYYWAPRLGLLLQAGREEEAAALVAELEAKDQRLLGRSTRRNPAGYALARARIALARRDLGGMQEEVMAVLRSEVARPLERNMALLLLAQHALCARSVRAARMALGRLGTYGKAFWAQPVWARLALLEGDAEAAARRMEPLVDPHFPMLAPETLRWAHEVSAYGAARLLARAAEVRASRGQPGRPARVSVAQPSPDPNAAGAPRSLLVGVSPAIRAVHERIAQYAAQRANLLITGETGTGKEVVARLLHERGPWVSAPLVPVNCGALSGFLIESELFGHVRGAFSGAIRAHDGVFIAAGEGTVLLDEIHALSPDMQVKLLRVLEDGEVRPVGGTAVRRSHARVIAMMNEEPERLIEAGLLREDLFYRLERLRIHLPPLRERKEDILPLLRHFLARFYQEFEVGLDPEFVRALCAHDWPGNVRELKNEVERIALTAGDATVLSRDMLRTFGEHRITPGHAASPAPPAPPPAERTSRLTTEDRRDWLLELFGENRRLTRKKVTRLLDCAGNTAARDLAALEERGLIRRVITSGSLRTSFYERC